MARETIYVSDLTGKPIDAKDAATVTIKYADARRGVYVLDANASEVSDLASKAESRLDAAGLRRSLPSVRREKREGGRNA